MAKSNQKRASINNKENIKKPRKESTNQAFFNMSLTTWIETAKIFYENKTLSLSQKPSAGSNFAKVFFVKEKDFENVIKLISRELSLKQIDFVKKSKQEIFEFYGSKGPLWLVRPLEAVASQTAGDRIHKGLVKHADACRVRDFYGQVCRGLNHFSVSRVELIFCDSSHDELRQALLGLELGSYRFNQEYFLRDKKLPKLEIFDLRFQKLNRKEENKLLQKSITIVTLNEIAKEASSFNLARHLVNLPPNILNPETYSKEIERVFSSLPGITVDVWKGDRLKKENMNLLLAVGGGAEHGPRLVHLKYRPKLNSEKQLSPIAFVGKGITFDSGGLDLKPSNAMRLMKKDMGGSAAVLGLCYFASSTHFVHPLDFYLSIAENSVDKKAFRPSDVLVARNNISVEISNTDAEGRLVLADAIDVALKQQGSNEPSMIIDVATLTGAIKVGLGTEIAGLFCNNDRLADHLFQAGLKQNDLCWPMPLFQNYRGQLKSQFADMMNCGEGGYGGAISAALFLETFVGQKPWAHLDIFSWKDSPAGAFSEPGGSGQSVLMLVEFLRRYALVASRGESFLN